MIGPRLGLGTVQFGLDYGISNRNGQPSLDAVKDILNYAAAHGIEVLDTAAAYGESESVLGSCLPPESDFRIVTKTEPVTDTEVGPEHAETLLSIFDRSRERLKQDSIYALLVHHADNLMKPGGMRLVEAMEKAKRDGMVEKIGVSVGNAQHIDAILDIWTPDLIQLPLNALDQRLVHSGHLARLAERNVEIHSRSVFFQGLLLMDPGDIPPELSPMRNDLNKIHDIWQSSGVTPLSGALAFAQHQTNIDTILVGVTSRQELADIVENFDAFDPGLPIPELPNPHVIEPTDWPQRSS